MTVDEMKEKIERIDEQIAETQSVLSANSMSPLLKGIFERKIRRLESKKANLEQDIQDRILENQLETAEVGETLRGIPGGSHE